MTNSVPRPVLCSALLARSVPKIMPDGHTLHTPIQLHCPYACSSLCKLASHPHLPQRSTGLLRLPSLLSSKVANVTCFSPSSMLGGEELDFDWSWNSSVNCAGLQSDRRARRSRRSASRQDGTFGHVYSAALSSVSFDALFFTKCFEVCRQRCPRQSAWRASWRCCAQRPCFEQASPSSSQHKAFILYALMKVETVCGIQSEKF